MGRVTDSHEMHPADNVLDKLPQIMEEVCLGNKMATTTWFNEIAFHSTQLSFDHSDSSFSPLDAPGGTASF